MATHSRILAWEIPWTEELTVHGVRKESDTTERLNNNTILSWLTNHYKWTLGFLGFLVFYLGVTSTKPEPYLFSEPKFTGLRPQEWLTGLKGGFVRVFWPPSCWYSFSHWDSSEHTNWAKTLRAGWKRELSGISLGKEQGMEFASIWGGQGAKKNTLCVCVCVCVCVYKHTCVHICLCLFALGMWGDEDLMAGKPSNTERKDKDRFGF